MGSEDEGEAEKRPAASKNPPAAASKKRKAESSSEDSSSDSEAAAPAAKKGKFVTSTPAPPKPLRQQPLHHLKNQSLRSRIQESRMTSPNLHRERKLPMPLTGESKTMVKSRLR